MITITKPYKPMYSKYNTLTPTMLMMMMMIIVSVMNINFALIKVQNLRVLSVVITIILMSLPQFYIIGILLKWICRQKLFRCQNLKSKSDSEVSLLAAAEG